MISKKTGKLRRKKKKTDKNIVKMRFYCMCTYNLVAILSGMYLESNAFERLEKPLLKEKKNEDVARYEGVDLFDRKQKYCW